MEKKKREIVKMLLNQEIGEKDEEEILDMLLNNPITIDVDKESDTNMTFGDKAADKISEVAGSWTFIILFCFFLVLWITLNTVMLVNAIDPYPFILLNLVLSCIASLQAPIIMMSQNRQAKKDSIRNKNDYHIDLKSELILEQLHDHMNTILKNQRKILSYLEENNIKDDDTK